MDESVRAGALQGFDEVVLELGGDPEQLLRRNGLDPRSLSNPEAMVSLAKVALLVEDATPFLSDSSSTGSSRRYPSSSRSQGSADRPVSERVRSALKSTVGANRGTKAEIAELLDLHPRTLQRRLTAEGTTFEEIRVEVYRSATRRLLLETAIPLSQVAAALGFSEQSAMNRSVRRWFDATPAQIRRNGVA